MFKSRHSLQIKKNTLAFHIKKVFIQVFISYFVDWLKGYWKIQRLFLKLIQAKLLIKRPLYEEDPSTFNQHLLYQNLLEIIPENWKLQVISLYAYQVYFLYNLRISDRVSFVTGIPNLECFVAVETLKMQQVFLNKIRVIWLFDRMRRNHWQIFI